VEEMEMADVEEKWDGRTTQLEKDRKDQARNEEQNADTKDNRSDTAQTRRPAT